MDWKGRQNIVFEDKDCVLIQDDCIDAMKKLPDNCIDMIFADPPYNLSNNGVTCYAGKMVSVNKGEWDKSKGFENDVEFHRQWISECKRILKPEGTIWISGTYHNIYQCGYLLQELKFHILNEIVWYKPNAAPNLACTTFAHSHETLIWAKKDKKAKHTFNYELMKYSDFDDDKFKAPNKQMRSVWSIPTPHPDEKKLGKHPTQKPLSLLRRIIMASTKENDIILDPFSGSSTTGLACKLIHKRIFIGIEKEEEFVNLSIRRLKKINEQPKIESLL